MSFTDLDRVTFQKSIGRLFLATPLRCVERAFWNLHSKTWDDTLDLDGSAARVERPLRLLKQAGLEARSEVLDIGSGTGNHVLCFHADGHAVTGLDYSSAMLNVARAKCTTLSDPPKFLEADFNRRLPVKDSMFDAVISVFTYQRVAAPTDFMAEIRRTLRGGGLLYLEAPLAYELYPETTAVARRGFWRLKRGLNALVPTYTPDDLGAAAFATGITPLLTVAEETSSILIARK